MTGAGASTPGLSAPVPLNATHDLSAFACRHAALAQWLQQRALAGESGAARTYVACAGTQVIGYYTLAAGAIDRASAPKAALRRNMPDPLPVIVLARLAVHQDWEGRGIGTGLLKDALLRAIQAAQIVGARLLVCHAIDDEARRFYLRHGFLDAPLDSALTVVAPLQ